ncbi:MAG: alanyl-tRNA editing protein [Alphaproteobacteria bacterium]|nr:alanyl-tRNA editing protein [Alphaproteobacteria bacterium]
MNPATELVFRTDPYARSCTARIINIGAEGTIELDRTVFYASSGGQPGDSGVLTGANGEPVEIATTLHPDGDKGRVVHVSAGPCQLAVGDTVTCELNWGRRHRLMRMHTALHLLSVVLDFPVTGGSIGAEKGRLDFDMPQVPDDRDAIEVALNSFVAADHPVGEEWITEAELADNPGLVKTMAVAPPKGGGHIRLIRIGTGKATIDLQPCGGTHVNRTGEIGALVLGKIEKKGRQNRRVTIRFGD